MVSMGAFLGWVSILKVVRSFLMPPNPQRWRKDAHRGEWRPAGVPTPRSLFALPTAHSSPLVSRPAVVSLETLVGSCVRPVYVLCSAAHHHLTEVVIYNGLPYVLSGLECELPEGRGDARLPSPLRSIA